MNCCNHIGLDITLLAQQVPILGEIALSPASDVNRPALLAIYAPFLLLPLGVAVRCLTAGPRMFPSAHVKSDRHML